MPSLPTVEILETPRLILRGHRVEDFADSAAMWADPLIARHIGGRPFTREETWTKLVRYVGNWALLGFGYWVATEKGSDRFVGEVGFADFHREIEPSFEGSPEIGWVLAAWAHGKGLATEAVQAVVKWGDLHLGAERSVCLIDPANVASIRVAQKCGYHQLRSTTYRGQPALVFERRAGG